MNQRQNPGNQGKRVVGYLRTAGDGTTPDASLPQQREQITRWCREHGHHLQQFYVEQCSGNTSIEARPEFMSLLEHAGAGRFDAVAVTSMDRWARDLAVLEQIRGRLHEAGAGLITVRENLDLDSPSGRLLFTMAIAVEQFTQDAFRSRRFRHAQS
ncbi:MAG: recombinase family protein [Dehalococcoidia bacterium]